LPIEVVTYFLFHVEQFLILIHQLTWFPRGVAYAAWKGDEIKGVGGGGYVARVGEMRNAYIFVGKPEGKRPF
jgi:hypothetical protein